MVETVVVVVRGRFTVMAVMEQTAEWVVRVAMAVMVAY
jgi:hypothetical protein